MGQTELHTDVRETDTDFACFVKAKDRRQVTFTLVSQDISADLVVDFWTMVQLKVRVNMRHGMTVPGAVEAVRVTFGIPKYPEYFDDAKLNGAARIAEAMRLHSNRKIAD